MAQHRGEGLKLPAGSEPGITWIILDPDWEPVPFYRHWPDSIERKTMSTTNALETVFLHHSDYTGRVQVIRKRHDPEVVVDTTWYDIVTAMRTAEPDAEFGQVTGCAQSAPGDEIAIDVPLRDLKFFVASRVLIDWTRKLEDMDADELLQIGKDMVDRWATMPTLHQCGVCGCRDRSICGCPEAIPDGSKS